MLLKGAPHLDQHLPCTPNLKKGRRATIMLAAARTCGTPVPRLHQKLAGNSRFGPKAPLVSGRYWCSRTKQFPRMQVWDDAEEFATATKKVNTPTVEWAQNFADNYELETEIAAGSFGKIWTGTSAGSGSNVAIKRISTERGNLSTEKVRAKVDQEVAVLKDVQGHPGVVGLHGTYLHDGHYNVVMDLWARDLKTLLKEHGTVSEALCAALAHEVLGVVRKCREAKVVHGDIKPANFVLASEEVNPFRSETTVLSPGWLKAIDFCSAQCFWGRPKDVIRGRCGTPVYMAPEVLWGYYGPEADMWSLGITLFHMMTGRYPLWDTEEAALQKSLVQVKEAVFGGPLKIDRGALGNPSHSCMDFLVRLLIRNSKYRMSLEEAEQHPFLSENLTRCDNGAVILGPMVSSACEAEVCASNWMLNSL